jgi:FtsZ-binding cell division protein ZapB
MAKIKKVQTTVQTINVSDVRKALQNMGDSNATLYNETQDLKVCQTAIKAYNSAINAAKAQLIHKKLTGLPVNIPFLS